MHLLIFGLGYSGHAIAEAARAAGMAVTATSRNPQRLSPPQGVRLVAFDAAAGAISSATHAIATAAPDLTGDPVLKRYADALAASPRLGWLGYLSTTGVYGDRGGGWVDETSAAAPSSERGRNRLAAEAAWTFLSAHRRLDIFRLAGIYGPGRSVLDDVRAGTARRVIKPGHAFGRIHRDDIAQAVLAAIRRPAPPDNVPGAGYATRIFNLNDDEPAESSAVIAEAARLLGQPLPQEVSFAEAQQAMSAMGRSFWADNRRVSSLATREALGITWRYPTFREGLRAILAEERGDSMPG